MFSIANAQEATAGVAGYGSALSGLLPLILVFLIFYFLVSRPQAKRQKMHREMLDNLQVGDKVLTSGGIIGEVTDLESDSKIEELVGESVVRIEIANNVHVKIAKNTITSSLKHQKVS